MSRKRALFFCALFCLLLAGVDVCVVCSTPNLEALLVRALRDAFGNDVSMGTLEGSALEGFRIADVRVAGAVGRPEFLRIERVRADVSLLNPLFGRPVLRQVTLEGVACTLAFAANGALELPTSLQQGSGAASPPELPAMALKGLRVRVLDAPHVLQRDVLLPFEDLAFELAPRRDAVWGYTFRCVIERSLLGRLSADGAIGHGTFSVTATRDGIHVDPALAAILAPDLAALVNEVQLAGSGTLTAALRSATSPTGEAVVTLSAAALLDRASARVKDWPLAITELSGVVRYEKGLLTLGGDTPLSGVFAHSPFSAQGTISLEGDVPRVALAGRLNRLELEDGLIESIRAMPDPGPEIARQLSVFRVRGLLDMHWKLGNRPGSLDAGVLALEPDLELLLSAGTFRYAGHFDYLLNNFAGALHVTDVGLEAPSLSASEGEMSFQAGVRVDYRRRGEEHYTVRAEAEHLPLDERLLRVLDPATRATIAGLRAEGRIRLLVRAHRPPGMREDPPAEVEIGLEGISLEPEFMPLRMEQVTGIVRPHGDVVHLDGVRALRAGGTVHLDGRVGLASAAGLLDLEVRGTDLLLDEDFARALDVLAPGAGAALASIQLNGRADCSLRIACPGGGVAPNIVGEIVLKGARITLEGTGVQLSDLNGRVSLSHQAGRKELTLQSGFTAAFAGRPLKVSGQCSFTGAWQFELSADALSVDEDLLHALAGVVPAFANTAECPRVRGVLTPKLRLASDQERVSWQLDGAFHGARFALAEWQTVALSACRGHLSANASGVRVSALEAEYQASGMTAAPLAAREVWIPAGPEAINLRDVRLRGVPLSAELSGFIGRAPADAAWPAGMSGVLSGTIPSLHLNRDSLRFEAGSLHIENLALGVEQPFSARVVRLDRVSFDRGVDGTHWRADLHGEGARLLKLPIPEFDGGLSGDEHGFSIEALSAVLIGRATRQLAEASLNDLRAFALELGLLEDPQTLALDAVALRLRVLAAEEQVEAGLGQSGLLERAVTRGLATRAAAQQFSAAELRALLARGRDARPWGVVRAQGSRFEVDFDGGFRTHLVLRDVSVAETISVLGGSPGEVRGRMQSELVLEGVLSDSATWKGSGSLQAEVWNAIQMPLMLGVLKAIDVTALFSDQRRAQVVAAFTLDQRAFHFTSGFVKSPGLRLEIMPPGQVSFDGAVELLFDVTHGGGVPVISDILGFIPSMLLNRLRVRGTLEEPEVEGGN